MHCCNPSVVSSYLLDDEVPTFISNQKMKRQTILQIMWSVCERSAFAYAISLILLCREFFFSCYTWNSMESQKAIYKTIFLVMWFKPNLMICIWNEKILHQHSNWWVNAWCKSQNIFISMLKTSQPLTKRFVIFHPANFPLAFSEHMYLNSNTELSLSR